MQTSEVHRSKFMTLTRKVLRDWSQFSSMCGSMCSCFEKPLTDFFLFDTEAQALPQAYLHGLTFIFMGTKCRILGKYDNNDAFWRLWSIIEQWSVQLSDIIRAHDSHHLDDCTVWPVLEELHELVLTLLRAGVPEIYRGPHMFIASQHYLIVIQSHHPNLGRLRFLLDLLLVHYHENEDVMRLPLTNFYTDVPHDTIMDCFRRSIALIQDPTVTIGDRLHVHTFVVIVSRSSPNYGRIFLANRVIYWLCRSMACFSLILAEDPYKYGDRVLHMGLTYLGNQLHLSGPECVSEALDADILHTVLKLERLFPWSSNLFVNIVEAVHKCLIFRSVERRVRKALDRIEKSSLDADFRSGITRDAWLAMKLCAQHVHAYKNCYRTSNCDDKLQCDNSQCPKDSLGRHPKRCTGCWITLYCSHACQKVAWKAHREKCHRWTQRRKDGVPGPVGDHDYFYIRHYIIEEVRANAGHIRDLKREYLKTHQGFPVRRLVINCDYNELPWAFQIISPKDIEEETGERIPPEFFDLSDKGKSQLARIVTPWKETPEHIVLQIFYTPNLPSDEHLLIRGL
ncbi:hypothetical protein ARMGADRAFT_283777 [Armillaria gallica]|uniref:MYND-type domain-containing protein n=1 Tax=Armillaria gallica TaxID=47427 RepID=A0A2H3DRP3_ARMGA|nr:hypothetical protein ARMGADRAFT_283777 [Armillaria gallica]